MDHLLRRGHRGGCIAVALVGFACSDAGILVEVTRDPATTTGDIDSLAFFVGIGDTSGGSMPMVGSAPAGERTSIGGRDLLSDPYRLLIRPGDHTDATLKVVAVGLRGEEVVAAGDIAQPIGFVDDRVTAWEVVLSGAGGDAVELTQTGCLTWSRSDGFLQISSERDRDCDGDPAGTDCDDGTSLVSHLRGETCANAVDDDCDGTVDEIEDGDGDGATNCDDCDDRDGSIHPGRTEICDGRDNDCNGQCDDGHDGDGDRYTTCGSKRHDDGSCTGPDPGLVDCRDRDPETRPGAAERCDGIDNDCDGRCDEEFDSDGDQLTSCGSHVGLCVGPSQSLIDCAADDPAVHPLAAELCDGVDNDCNGVSAGSTVACFATGANASTGCALGERPCDSGGPTSSSCQTQDDITAHDVLPAPLCTAYVDCAGTVSDPVSCAVKRVATERLSCAVPYVGGGLCGSRQLALAARAESNAACTWRLVGGYVYPAMLAALRKPGDSNWYTVLGSCEAVLELMAFNTNPPEPETFLLWQSVNDEARQIITVTMVPNAVKECPPAGPLHCIAN
jgi:hypothetical protein